MVDNQSVRYTRWLVYYSFKKILLVMAMKGAFIQREFLLKRNNQLALQNEQLIREIAKLRAIIGDLRKQTRSLMIERLNFFSMKISNDKQTQTEPIAAERDSVDFLDPFYTPYSLGRLKIKPNIYEKENSDNIMVTPVKNAKAKLNDRFISTDAAGSKLSSSPVSTRVSEILTQKVLSPIIDEGDTNPVTKTDRPKRSVRKPISYREPSLTQKVRRGFKFFQFNK